MQKTYWWRMMILFIGTLVVSSGFIYENYLCFSNGDKCLFDEYRLSVFEPLVLLSVSLAIVSLFLFFVNDIIFKKWLKFTVAWFALATVFIAFSPVYDSSPIGLNPTKESVSIWMGSLFVIISLALIFWQSHKLKKS